MRITALIVAAGTGSRFGGERPKQYVHHQDRPILAHTIAGFKKHQNVNELLCVIHADHQDMMDEVQSHTGPVRCVVGGHTRQDSVLRGLEALAKDPPDYVLIHDGARPCISAEVIDRVIDALKKGAAGVLPAVPATDTLKRRHPDDTIAETVDREQIVHAQTPQGFIFEQIFKANRQFSHQTVTDDTELLSMLGFPVKIVKGDTQNIKITHAQDLENIMTTDLTTRDCSNVPPMVPTTGLGYDVHRFGPGDHVRLCGIDVPHCASLTGHSDADVGLHALTDAILGALSDGDIGSHFPPSDNQWKAMDSAHFLEHAIDLVEAAGGFVYHVDVTLICEDPKIGPHREEMRQRIADLCRMDIRKVSVKATTTERLGFAGRREGIASQAAASLMLPLTLPQRQN